MENATADRSGRSERRRESDGLANGAFSGPGVCGRTICNYPGKYRDNPIIYVVMGGVW